MTGHPPSPVMAAVGLVATAASGLRHVPHVLGSAGQAAARRYDELALRGQEVLAGHPHPADRSPEAVPWTAPESANDGPVTGGPVVDDAPGPWAVDEPGGVEPEVVTAFRRTGPVVLPDDVREEVAQMTPGADLAHHELPLADFDHETVPQLRGRLRSLGLAELVQLRDYEQAHAARLPVLTLLDNRIAKMLEDTEK